MSLAGLIIDLTDRRCTGLTDTGVWFSDTSPVAFSVLTQLSVEADWQERGTVCLVTAAWLWDVVYFYDIRQIQSGSWRVGSIGYPTFILIVRSDSHCISWREWR